MDTKEQNILHKVLIHNIHNKENIGIVLSCRFLIQNVLFTLTIIAYGIPQGMNLY